MPAWWGIHNNAPEIDFVDEGFVALGWDLIAEVATPLARDREALKTELRRHYPHKNERAVGAWAGIFVRFVLNAREGDIVVHPHKEEKTVNFGRIAGPYEFAMALPTIAPAATPPRMPRPTAGPPQP